MPQVRYETSLSDFNKAPIVIQTVLSHQPTYENILIEDNSRQKEV